MATARIRDNSIWIRHIEGDPRLRERLSALPAGGMIELAVRGTVGRWERMKDGKDGRPTPGIKPVGTMKDVWSRWQADRGEIVEIREVASADGYLRGLSDTLSEWDSPEDEQAYADL